MLNLGYPGWFQRPICYCILVVQILVFAIYNSTTRSYFHYHYQQIISSLDKQIILREYETRSMYLRYIITCGPLYLNLLQLCYRNSPGLLTKRQLYAKTTHFSNLEKALLNWLAINASGFLFYCLRVRYSDLSELRYINHDTFVIIISFALIVWMSSRFVCPGFDTNIPNGLATVAIYMSLVIDNYEINYPGCCYNEHIYYIVCASLYSFIFSLMERYIPYEADVVLGIATSFVICVFSCCMYESKLYDNLDTFIENLP